MHDLDVQIRGYIDATSDPVTVDEVFNMPVGAEPVRPIVPRQPERRRNGGWLIAGAAAALVLLIGGVVPFLFSGESSPPTATTIPVPTSVVVPEPIEESTPTTTALVSEVVPVIEGDPLLVEWARATGPSPMWIQYGISPIVSNGSSFLGVRGDDEDATLVRSITGVDWVEVASPTVFSGFPMDAPIAAGLHYVMSSAQRDLERCSNSVDIPCDVLVSSDGLTWESEPSTMGYGWVNEWVWRVETPAAVVLGNPPNMQQVDAFGTVIMEFPERLVIIGVEHGRDHVVGAFESTEQGIWTRIDPPTRFVEVMTTEYNEAGWQSMWRCEFAARDGQAMALIAGEDGYELWNTTDGINWNQLPDPPTGIEPEGRGRCIKAVDNGWIIGPGGDPGDEIILDTPPVTTTPDALIFSEDGNEWTTVTVEPGTDTFTGQLETAGNSIFIMNIDTGETLVGTIKSP